MALTVKQVGDRHNFGDQAAAVYDLTFDASYPAKGYPFTPQMVGFHYGTVIVTSGGSVTRNAAQGATSYEVVYDDVAQTVRVFGAQVTTAGSTVYAFVEVPAGTNLSGQVVRVMVVGV
jgi:hypothetical protein